MLATAALLISLSILTIHGQDLKVDNTAPSDCYEGNGKTYQGVANMTENGVECLVWDSELKQSLESKSFFLRTIITLKSNQWSRSKYCRNPDEDEKPWCFIRKEDKTSWEFCKIEKCPGEPGPSPFSHCGEGPPSLSFLFKQHPDGHPWQVSVQMRPSDSSSEFLHACGGALLSSCWVLTAATCVLSTHEYQVVLGANTGKYEVQTVPVIQTIVHENFSAIGFLNDIALLQLQATDSPFCAKENRFVKSVCLPDQNFPAGTTCRIATWGIANTSRIRSQPFSSKIELVSKEQCKAPEVHGDTLDNSMLCAENLDTSMGSGGSPLVCQRDHINYVTGLLSWGDGTKSKPEIYANVYMFVDWIKSKINSTSVN